LLNRVSSQLQISNNHFAIKADLFCKLGGSGQKSNDASSGEGGGQMIVAADGWGNGSRGTREPTGDPLGQSTSRIISVDPKYCPFGLERIYQHRWKGLQGMQGANRASTKPQWCQDFARESPRGVKNYRGLTMSSEGQSDFFQCRIGYSDKKQIVLTALYFCRGRWVSSEGVGENSSRIRRLGSDACEASADRDQPVSEARTHFPGTHKRKGE